MKTRVMEYTNELGKKYYQPEYQEKTFWGKLRWYCWGNEEYTIKFYRKQEAIDWLNRKAEVVYET